MPGKQQLLDYLGTIANDGLPAAIAWHVLIASVLLALFDGWRPSQRTLGLLLVVPLLSVSAAAATHGNPFNALVVGVGALALLVLGARLPRERVRRGTPAEVLTGVFGIALGVSYPHFLTGHSPAIYLVAAPVGLLPCPTFSVIAGFALLSGGFRARGWSTLLASFALFYGVFGAFRLEVWLDLGLVAVALALLGSAWLPHRAFTTSARVPPAA